MQPMRLLVVADLESAALRIRRALADTGLEIACRPSGGGLLSTYLTLRPDLVVVDLALGETPAAEVVAPLTACGWGGVGVPVIVVVDRRGSPLSAAALEAGARDVVGYADLDEELPRRVLQAVESRHLQVTCRRQRDALATLLAPQPLAPLPVGAN